MAADRQLPGYDRLLVVGLGLKRMGDTADDDFRRGPGHSSGRSYAMAKSLDEQPSVRVQHDLDNARIVEGDAEFVSEGILQLADQAGMGAELGHAALLIEAVSLRVIAEW
ncbi:hypothetical protein GCM10007920_32250 [Ciceribacter naphthalenivorans]|uniref:Uncharacterized protein n=2 Tax=Alphaproteobacteria TaxID=28211 RepID=A0A512HKF6_9HYPH|nr:hypothetical protein RNA01_28590 [Ciceribacter naphthalenivorans]GLR23434.1 hypothetical protein GCM10007920_32250 [Ciceribacter naphthalenivorans]GLT06290.1 hypothetical protein GCM10007926_32250 [Sphingomonas psychrolutea]